MGIPDEILTGAGGYLDGADRQAAELIHGLEKTQTELSKQKEVLGNVIRLGQKYHNAAESLHDSLQTQRDRILKNFETASRKLLRQSEDELMKILKEQKKRLLIRPDADFKADEAARGAVADIKKKLHSQFPAKPEKHAAVEHLAPGDSVLVMHLNKTGSVVSADNEAKKAEIAIGAMRIKTGFHELAAAPAAGAKSRGPMPARSR
jgi:dsDNA-specific endonuclease/ATPase MutS2